MSKDNLKKRKQRVVAKHIKEILNTLGYDLHDPNYAKTPARVARTWIEELLVPVAATKKLFSTFPEDHSQMITLQGHEVWTRCPHHLERVKMIVTVSYIPNGRVLGLSKLARIANFFAHGLVLQETFAEQLAEGLYGALKPKGVGIYVTGNHQCMQARGVRTTGSVITTALRGCYSEEPATKNEFLDCCKLGGNHG